MSFPEVPLRLVTTEVFNRNRDGAVEEVYSVTNEQGFMPSEEFFSKQVYSRDIDGYKIVSPGQFAYNPSRVNVGSIDYLKYPTAVAISPMYVVFDIDEDLILHDYLLYFLKSELGVAWINHMTAGSVRDTLRFDDLGRIEIPLPPLPEQARIVAILRQADELRRLRQQARAKADHLLSALFHTVFDSPALWQKTIPLGECVDFVGGGTPSRNIGEYFKGDIPWATSKDIKSRYLDDAQEHITHEAITNSATKLVPSGTILLVVKSKILMHSLPLGITTRSFCFGQDVKGLVCMPQIEPQFIVAAMLAQTSYILEQARGLNTEGLTLEILRRIPIPDVDPEAQEKFVNLVKAFDEVEGDTEVSHTNLQKLFESLIGRAFSGELTAIYRTQNQAELQEAAAQRDIALGLRGQESRLIDFEAGRVTAEEEEQFRQQINQMIKPVAQEMAERIVISPDALAKSLTPMINQNMQYQSALIKMAEAIRPALPNYENLVNSVLAESVASLNKATQSILASAYNVAAAMQPIAEAAQRSQALYQSLAENIIALAAQADAQVRQAAQQEPPQPDRAIHGELDASTKTILQVVQALPTYFTPAELHQLLQMYGRHFDHSQGNDLVQIEAALHLLQTLGFVRRVALDNRLVYRLVDPIDDGAILPEELAG